MKETDGGGVNIVNQRDALLSLKPKLTQQVSSPPEETLHVGKAAQITYICAGGFCLCVYEGGNVKL